MINSKKFLIVLFFGFIISIFLSHYNLENFDKHDGVVSKHLMVLGDINSIWNEAESFKRDFFEQDKSFLESGKEYVRTFLPSKILAMMESISISFVDPSSLDTCRSVSAQQPPGYESPDGARPVLSCAYKNSP